MPDPFTQREVGRVSDVFGGDLIVGVELNMVTLGHEHLEKFRLPHDAAEEFAQVFVRACWEAARQGGAL